MKKYSKTNTETKLVTSSNLSRKKATNICQQLFQEETNVETTSQSGIFRSKNLLKLKK